MSTPGPVEGTRAPSAGYTVVELMIVMLLVALLLGMGVNSLNRASHQRATRGARDTFVWMARRAQALAVQQGARVRLVLHPASRRARVTAPGRPAETVYFFDEYRTTISAGASDSVWICFEPRGYANASCSSPGLPVTVTFRRATDSAQAVVQPLGQVEAL